MSNLAGAVDYAPLDQETYRHQALLLRSLHCARPVHLEGREGFIHTLSSSQAGGRVEMTVYLAGDPAPVDSARITVERDITSTERK